MKITPLQSNSTSQNFNGALNNKILLKSLEGVANHSATFIAGTSLLSAIALRPAAIALSPKTDKQNKQYAMTNSIASGIIKFAMVEAVAIPVENAIKNIDKNPQKFLKPETINNLKSEGKSLLESKNYNVLTQILKQFSGIITTYPKSMLTIALIPFIMNLLFPDKDKKNNQDDKYNSYVYNQKNSVFNNINNNRQNLSFKGGTSDILSKGVGKVIDNKGLQSFIKKMNFNEANVARNMSMLTDIMLTGSFVYRTNKSKKIKEERKKPLIYNNIISTAITLTMGYGLDNMIKKNSQGFIEKFTEANKNNPKLSKYIEGINVVRPTLIFALIYYGILPIFSTSISDKIDKHITKSKEKNTK